MDIKGLRGREQCDIDSRRALLFSAHKSRQKGREQRDGIGEEQRKECIYSMADITVTVMETHESLRLGSGVCVAMEIFYICVHECFIIFMCASVI